MPIKPQEQEIDKNSDEMVIDVNGVPTRVKKIQTEIWIDEKGHPVLTGNGELSRNPKLLNVSGYPKGKPREVPCRVGNQIAKAWGVPSGGKYKLMKYTTEEELESKIEEFFKMKESEEGRAVYNKDGDIIKYIPKPITLESLTIYLGISKYTWKKYKETHHPNFADICQRAQDRMSDRITECSLMGEYKENFAKHILNNNDSEFYADKREIKNTNIKPSYEINIIEFKNKEDARAYEIKQQQRGNEEDIIDAEIIEDNIKEIENVEEENTQS